MVAAPSPNDIDSPARRTGWPLERVLFALAGSMTLLSAALSALVSPWFLLLAALVGVNQWLFVLFGACPASAILRRLFSLRSVLYPTQVGATGADRRSGSCPTPAPGPSGYSPAMALPSTASRTNYRNEYP
jgi:hypothetical protein